MTTTDEYYTIDDLLDDLWAEEQARNPAPTDDEDVDVVEPADDDDPEYFVLAAESWKDR